jgi:murein DD-endopeptidase MepM/ murein hydrolase activator NlpD
MRNPISVPRSATARDRQPRLAVGAIRVLLLTGALALAAGCAPRSGGPAPVSTPEGGRPRPAATAPAGAQSAAAVVQSGDTLFAVARRHNVGLRALIDANDLQAPYRVFPGQRLRLPQPAAPAAAASSAAAASASAPAEVPRGAPPVGTAPARMAAEPEPPAAADPAAPARAGRFAWPVRGTVISSFGTKPGGLQNDGINIAAPRGTPVRAAENGVVVYAGNELRGFGNLLLLRHADGWMSAYAHLDETLVERGSQVRRGQTIGRVGQTGSVSAPQLHFELRRGGRAVDPRGLLPLEAAAAD